MITIVTMMVLILSCSRRCVRDKRLSGSDNIPQISSGSSSQPRVISGNRGLAAAKKLVKKKVFCIDNVDTSFSPDDVQRYVSSFPVNVLSCFPAKPRRRRNENEPITDRKAFRLCIDANDQDKLLNPDKWPDSITIAEWYHLSSSASRQHGDADGETGNAVGGRSSDARESAVSDVAVADAGHDDEVTEDMESDDTVLRD